MSERMVPQTTYFVVFGALILLTVLTVGVSFLDLGSWHTVAGLSIASAKATLVALFFMHLLHGNRLTWIVVGGAMFWFGILLTLTLSDYLTRHWLAY